MCIPGIHRHIFDNERYVKYCAGLLGSVAQIWEYSYTEDVEGWMTIDEFDAALSELGWRVSDFCRATGLHRNTPSRWRNEKGVEIPAWVPKHLALLLELKRLHTQYLVPPKE